MSRYLDPEALVQNTGALRLAGLAGVRAPAPRRHRSRPGWPVMAGAGCGCRVQNYVVVLCEHHFTALTQPAVPR